MTPEYATPEQVMREPVSTATDVYALGVVLYELLTGRGAQRLRDRTPAELREVICERYPPRPSEAVAEIEPGAGDAASATGSGPALPPPGMTPRALRRKLAGDLDHIVLKALRKDPRERYASVDALAADVQRHLAGRLVDAHPATPGYRARRFVGRHRLGVAVAAAVSLLVIMSAAVAVWNALEAERNSAEAQRNAERAERIRQVLVATFESSDPDRAQGASAFARTVLDPGVVRMEADLAGEPDVLDDMRLVVAQVYRKLGLFDKARPLVERAYASRRAREGERGAGVAAALHARGELLYLAGRHDSAAAALREALEIRQAVLGPEHRDVSQTLGHLGEALRLAGALDSAESLARQTLELRRRVYGPEHAEVALALNQVGVVLREHGRTEQALPYYEQAVAMLRRVRGEGHSETLVAQNNLAQVLRTRGDLRGAEREQSAVLAGYRRLYGASHPLTILAMNNLAVIDVDMGDLAGGEALLRQVLDLWRARGGDEHPLAVATRASLGVVLMRAGKPVAAESLLRTVVQSWTRALGPDHPNLTVAYMNLAAALNAQRQYGAAERELRTALAISRAKLGPTHPRSAGIMVGIASALLNQGRCAEAEPMLREVLAAPAAGRAEPERRVGEAHVVLGRCMTARRSYPEAERLLLAAYAMFQGQPARERERREAARALVTLYEATGRRAEAERYRAGS
jgi:serine/threonine-protein kinase